jgi:hypothetical protein
LDWVCFAGLEDGAQGPDEDHSEDDVGRAHELPVGGGDLLEAVGVFREEAAAEEEAVDGEDFGGCGKVDGSQDDVGSSNDEND